MIQKKFGQIDRNDLQEAVVKEFNTKTDYPVWVERVERIDVKEEYEDEVTVAYFEDGELVSSEKILRKGVPPVQIKVSAKVFETSTTAGLAKELAGKLKIKLEEVVISSLIGKASEADESIRFDNGEPDDLYVECEADKFVSNFANLVIEVGPDTYGEIYDTMMMSSKVFHSIVEHATGRLRTKLDANCYIGAFEKLDTAAARTVLANHLGIGIEVYNPGELITEGNVTRTRFFQQNKVLLYNSADFEKSSQTYFLGNCITTESVVGKLLNYEGFNDGQYGPTAYMTAEMGDIEASGVVELAPNEVTAWAVMRVKPFKLRETCVGVITIKGLE